MRDFRDAKVMAKALRAALAANGRKVTIGQSLELMAHAFGVADWNTLSATIRAERTASSKNILLTPPIAENSPALKLCAETETSLRRAFAYATQRKHEYATLEHLLLALIDDLHASAVMTACSVDLDMLRRTLSGYVDNGLDRLVTNNGEQSKPTTAFARVLQRAVINAQELRRPIVTGAEVLISIFPERLSLAARSLEEQHATRSDVVEFIVNGRFKGSGVVAE